jgi:hypothetical protein
MTKKRQVADPSPGMPLTDDDIRRLADDAEAGFEPSRLRPRRGRPHMGSAPAEVVAVRLDPELCAAVEARASTEQTSTSEIIREALRRSSTSPDQGRKKDGRNGKRTGNTGHFRSLQTPTVTQETGSDEGHKPMSRHIRVGRMTVRFPPAPPRPKMPIYLGFCNEDQERQIPPSPHRGL